MNDDQPQLDPKVLQTLHAAIGDSLSRIIKLFLSDTPQLLHDMQHALNNQDLNTVGRLAHSLKASSANLGAMQVAQLAINLEQAITNHETDPNKLNAQVTAIQNAFDQVSHMFGPYL